MATMLMLSPSPRNLLCPSLVSRSAARLSAVTQPLISARASCLLSSVAPPLASAVSGIHCGQVQTPAIRQAGRCQAIVAQGTAEPETQKPQNYAEDSVRKFVKFCSAISELLLVIIASATIVNCHRIALFVSTTGTGVLYYSVIISIFIAVSSVLNRSYQKYHHGFLLYNSLLGFFLGRHCLNHNGVVVLRSVGATAALVAILMFYQWPLEGPCDLSYIGRIMTSGFAIHFMVISIQLFFPAVRMTDNAVYSALLAAMWCLSIILLTNDFFKVKSFDEDVYATIYTPFAASDLLTSAVFLLMSLRPVYQALSCL